jgi:hypothetical protein
MEHSFDGNVFLPTLKNKHTKKNGTVLLSCTTSEIKLTDLEKTNHLLCHGIHAGGIKKSHKTTHTDNNEIKLGIKST